MSPAVAAQHSPPPSLPVYRLSVAQYHAMLEQGILKSGDPIELLEGIFVRKMTKHSPHRFATQSLRDLIPPMLPAGWFVDDQEPITTKDSEPEPDLAIYRGSWRDYLAQDRHPGPEDTCLVIEIGDSTIVDDQTTKNRIYARAGVPCYWIVNFPDPRIEVYTGPTGPVAAPSYQHRQDFVPGQEIPVLVGGQEVGRVEVAELFL
jgi:Uma2 family endonuclease